MKTAYKHKFNLKFIGSSICSEDNDLLKDVFFLQAYVLFQMLRLLENLIYGIVTTKSPIVAYLVTFQAKKHAFYRQFYLTFSTLY